MAKKVEATLWRKAGASNSWTAEFVTRPDQAQAPEDAGTQRFENKAKASIEAEAEKLRAKGYGVEWRLGGFVE